MLIFFLEKHQDWPLFVTHTQLQRAVSGLTSQHIRSSSQGSPNTGQCDKPFTKNTPAGLHSTLQDVVGRKQTEADASPSSVSGKHCGSSVFSSLSPGTVEALLCTRGFTSIREGRWRGLSCKEESEGNTSHTLLPSASGGFLFGNLPGTYRLN